MSTGPIVVYGANGATGALLVRLAGEAGHHVIVAGRRRKELEAVAGGHEVRVGSLQPEELDAICAGAAAVVSCVAPYTLHGRPLAEAAIRQRAHYVDCTGEPRYVQTLLAEYDGAAREAGISLVPAAGIGLCANVVARAAVAVAEHPRRLIVDYRVRHMIPSAGTVSSTLRILAGGAPIARDGEITFEPAGGAPVRLPGGGWGARFPLTDVVTLQRQWPDAEIAGYIRSGAAPLIAPAMRLLSGIPRRPKAVRALDRLASRLLAAAPAARGQFDVSVTAETSATTVRAVGHVEDIYAMTSRAALHVTELLIAGPPAAGFRATGEIAGDPHAVCAAVGIDLAIHSERQRA